MLHDQAGPRERAKAPLAHVRGEEVQLRRFRQLMHASVAIEMLRIQPLEQPRRRDSAARPAECESPEDADRDQERDTPGDLVAGIGLDEGDNLRGRPFEVRRRAVVASPVQREVGTQDAAARDRDDVRHLAEQARITQEADDTKVKQGGPQSATGECQSESRHLTLSSRFAPSIPQDPSRASDSNGA